MNYKYQPFLISSVVTLSFVSLVFSPTVALASSNPNMPIIITTTVKTGRGTFIAKLVKYNRKGKFRFVMDTATSNNCLTPNKCPLLPFQKYVSKRKAIGGLNGTYFNHTVYGYAIYNYFSRKVVNSDRAVLEAGPMVGIDTLNNLFYYPHTRAAVYGGSVKEKIESDSKTIGGSGKIQAVIVSPIALVEKGKIAKYGANGIDLNSKLTRTGIGWDKKYFYTFVVYRASIADIASVGVHLGLDYAMGLDGGGSTALYANGKYLIGPGRSIPNAFLVLKK